MGCFRVACAASGIEVPTYSAELPRETSGEAGVDILSQSSRGVPRQKTTAIARALLLPALLE